MRSANHSAVKLVDLVTRNFPGFRDTSIYKGQLIHFYKRAQIFVADLWGAFGRPTGEDHPYHFRDIEAITMFADYRVPQILRHVGILTYSPQLAEKVDARQELAVSCEEEVEIRALTILAVERMRERVNAHRKMALTSIEIDWILWNWGEGIKEEILPHHRTLTIYY